MDATDFPADLVQTQYAFNAAYEALAASCARDTAGLRRRLLRLSVRLWWHPYWATVPSVPAARTELRQLARAGEPSGPRDAGTGEWRRGSVGRCGP